MTETPATVQPPEPLTAHERSLELVKALPPEPTWAYYLLAAGTSLGGVILGLIYLAKSGYQNKAFGVRALLLGLVLPLTVVAIVFVIRASQPQVFTPVHQPGVLLP